MGLREISDLTHRKQSTVRKWFTLGKLKRVSHLGASCWLSDLLDFLDEDDDESQATAAGQQRRAAHARGFRSVAQSLKHEQATKLDWERRLAEDGAGSQDPRATGGSAPSCAFTAGAKNYGSRE
jgi:hypothetical protein